MSNSLLSFKVLKKGFVKNILTLFTSNSIAQFVSLAFYPLYTRLYAPDVFGVFGVYLSIVSIVTVVLNGRLDVALPLCKNNYELSHLLKISVLLGVSISVVFFVVSLLVRAIFFDRMSELYIWLPFIALNLLANSFFSPLYYLAVYKSKYKNISVYNVSLSIVNMSLRILFGYYLINVNGLILSHLVSTFLCVVILAFLLRKYNIEILKESFRFSYIKPLLSKFKDFPLFNSFHALSNTFASNVPYLVLSSFFSKEIAGYYTISSGILFKPVNLVANSLNTVLYQKHAANIKNKIESRRLIQRVRNLLGLFALPCFLVLLLLTPDIYTSVFGSEWGSVSMVVRIITPWVFMVLLTSSLSFIPNTTNNLKYALRNDLIYSAFKIMALFIGVLLNNWILSIVFYSFVGTSFLIYYQIWYNGLIIKSDRNILKNK